MKKYVLAIAILLFSVNVYAAVELDADSNGGVDIDKGGTNAVTASAARTALGVPATADTLVGDCTVGPCLDGTVDGGNLIKLWAGTGTYWTALQGGAPEANRSWRLPIGAPPAAGAFTLINLDEYGNMGQQATSANVISLLGAANYAAIKGLLDTDDIQTLTGIASGTAHLGTFTGTTITDSSTIKTALQELETAVEAVGGGEVAPSSLELTTDTNPSEAQWLANKYITNQGSSAEVDVVLPAFSYRLTRTIVVEEEQIIEVCPPSGEAFMLNGTLLDANDCIDSPAIVGSQAIFTRMKNAAGTWFFNVGRVQGDWLDTGATD